MNTNFTNIDEYLALQKEDVKNALQELRETIISVCPDAEEKISYGMPAFKYNGMLVYFAAFEKHCSFFPGSTVAKFQDELKEFKTSKGTIQFTLDKPIPKEIIVKIVETRVQENLEKTRWKTVKKKAQKDKE